MTRLHVSARFWKLTDGKTTALCVVRLCVCVCVIVRILIALPLTHSYCDRIREGVCTTNADCCYPLVTCDSLVLALYGLLVWRDGRYEFV